MEKDHLLEYMLHEILTNYYEFVNEERKEEIFCDFSVEIWDHLTEKEKKDLHARKGLSENTLEKLIKNIYDYIMSKYVVCSHCGKKKSHKEKEKSQGICKNLF